MSEPILGPGDRYLEHVRDLERRVSELERSRRLPFSTQRGGTFELRSEAGDNRLRFGDFGDPDGSSRYGVAIYDADGSAVFLADEDQRGAVYPLDQSSWIVPTPQSITSGSFAAVAETQVLGLNGSVLYATGALLVPASTIAECRVIDIISGQATNVLQVNGGVGGVNGNLSLSWAHPFAVGWGDDDPDDNVFLAWQIRRQAGAGTITAFPPRGLLVGNQRFLGTHAGGLAFV